MNIRKVPLPSNRYSVKAPYPMQAEYITVHNTYNDASANNEVTYMFRNNSAVSYHVAIDDKEIIEAIPFNRSAWHAGDGAKGTGNRKSIGIEICYSKSGGERYKKAEENAVKYIAKLLKERGWGIERVKKHEDWSGKYCPHRILAEKRWGSFLKRIENEMKGGLSVSEYNQLQAQINELNATIKSLQTQLDGKANARSDAKVSDWSKEFYDWAVKEGLTDGSNPRGALTREQSFVMFKRFYDLLDKRCCDK